MNEWRVAIQLDRHGAAYGMIEMTGTTLFSESDARASHTRHGWVEDISSRQTSQIEKGKRQMVRRIEDEIEYYYDSHSTEEDLMGETAFHAALVRYLVDILTLLFKGQPCAIHENLNIYQTANWKEYPLAPDVAVFKGVAFHLIRSWKVGKTGPAPQVAFEIASEETWAKDLDEKPAKYGRMGVQEYYAYDPNEPTLPRSRSQRLYGWQRDSQLGVMRPVTPGERGELWSSQLESWLVPDGVMLRLYDRNNQIRLTDGEAEAWRANMEARRADEATRRAEIEAHRTAEATRRAEIEARRVEEAMGRAEEASRQAKVLREKLRSLGVDPDQLI
jgi:Uma2 family endonuclease